MKKVNRVIAFAILILGMTLVSTSCKKKALTFADKLKSERKAIAKFVKDSSLVILKEFPKDGKFKEKEFFLTEDGVYINIVDQGTGHGATKGKLVYIRYKKEYFGEEEPFTVTNIEDLNPVTFIHGGMNQNLKEYAKAWNIPLEHIKHGAVVKMIVPFKLSVDFDFERGAPTYYSFIKYRFEK